MEEEGEATHLDPVQGRPVALPLRQLVLDYELPVSEFKMDLGPPEPVGQTLRGAPLLTSMPVFSDPFLSSDWLAGQLANADLRGDCPHMT